MANSFLPFEATGATKDNFNVSETHGNRERILYDWLVEETFL